MPSSHPSAKWVKPRFGQAPVDSFSDDPSSEPTQIELSTPSPNYLKETSNSAQASSHNSESSFENNPKERESDSWKPDIVSFPYVKPLGNSKKVLSLRSNRASKKKSSGIAPFPEFTYCVMPHQEGNESEGALSSYRNKSGMGIETETGKTLKPNSRFAKSRFNHPSPNYFKATNTSEGKKMHSQASFHDSESSNGATDESRNNSKQTSSISSLKSKRTLKRTPSLRPIGILMNKSSFKFKKPSVKKCSQISEVSRVNKANCSSAFKDWKFPHCVEKRESARISFTVVCPYSYCSLHGSSKPPLKRVLSKKRYLLKTQKSMKLRRGKYPVDIMELNETSINVGNEEDSDLAVQIYANQEFFGRSGEGNEDDNLAELIIGETSYRKKDFQGNLKQDGPRELEEPRFECCSCDEVPSSDLEFCKLENDDLNGLSCESANMAEISHPSMGESPEDNSAVFSASVCDGNKGDSAADGETVGLFAPGGNSEASFTSEEAPKSDLHKRNHISLWHLIHQHVVSEGAENQLLENKNEEKQLDYQNTNIENNDQDIKIRKMYATKVVREAIEKILLPEVEDQSSDDQSSSGDSASEKDILEKEEEKAKKRTPNSWSNLKKYILLKRFIQAVEKVRKHNQRKPHHLTLENNPEAENILLKPPMMDKKRSLEEWMLDYALQHVVSELAPTQKRKVGLLIKAFETLAPPTDEEQIQLKIEKIPDVPVDGKHEDSASRGQTMKVDSLSGETAPPPLTENQTAEGYDKITSSDAHNGSFKQLDLVGEVRNGDSDSLELLTTMHKQKSTLTDFCKDDNPESEREKLEVGDLTSATKRTPSDDNAEAAAENIVAFSACGCDPMEELIKAGEQKCRDPELDNRSIQEFKPVNDSKPDNSNYEACKSEFKREKHVNMWQLIHRHMVSGLSGEGKTKNLLKENEDHVGDTNTFAATESSGSCLDLCSWDQSTGMGYHGTESQEVELRKNFSIKLVREAIEKILLPEVQDQSSDDQSVTSDIMSDEELIEKSDVRGGEQKISTSADSAKDCSIDCCRNMSRYDLSRSQEGTSLTTASISESENEKTASKAQSEKKTPKGWTNLKKLILLKRFIKELKKVKKFTPIEPLLLLLKPGAEAVEVSSSHQMVDEKKSTKQWMLDYALRKVIGELAPKQKRKVALLVKAFETVAPTSGTPQIQLTFSEFKDSSHECGCSGIEQHNFVSEVTEADTKVKNILTSNLDNCHIHSTITDEESNVTEDTDDQKAANEDPASSFQLELLKNGSASTGRNTRLDDFEGVNVHLFSVSKSTAADGTGVPTSTYNTNSSASASEPFADQVIATKEQNKGDPETDCKTTVASKAQLGKQKHICMWHLLCQHVVSDIAMKVESQLPDGEDEDGQVDSPKTFLQPRSGSFHKEDSRSQINGFSQRDAVKLVREAIEEILSPEVQDDSLSDAKSVVSDTVTEQEHPETDHGNVGDSSIVTSTDSLKDGRKYIKSEEKGHKIIHRELAANSIPMPDEQRTASMLGNKSDQKNPPNWSKLKKLIFLKRSIKALEKARKPMLPATQSLQVKLGKEEEKVDLRHRSREEKKRLI